jgi:hypothetical protein
MTMLMVFSNLLLLAVVAGAKEPPLAPGGRFLWWRQDRDGHTSGARVHGLAV